MINSKSRFREIKEEEEEEKRTVYMAYTCLEGMLMVCCSFRVQMALSVLMERLHVHKRALLPSKQIES